MGRILGRLVLALVPLALTPLWGFLLGEGYVNLGAGCKDILALIPWVVWALGFLASLVCWRRGTPLLKTLGYAAAGATGFMVSLWLVLFIYQAWLFGLKGL
jgi:hypothetical protein